jgi:hypothetical protein
MKKVMNLVFVFIYIVVLSSITFADYNYTSIDQYSINSTVDLYQDGYQNSATMIQGEFDINTVANYASSRQIGNRNYIYQEQMGNYNNTTAYQQGDNNEIIQLIRGSSNNIDAAQQGDDNFILQYINGDSYSIFDKQIGNSNMIYRYNSLNPAIGITQIGNGLSISIID